MKTKLAHIFLLLVGVGAPVWAVVDTWQASQHLGVGMSWWPVAVGVVGALFGLLTQIEHVIPGLSDETGAVQGILNKLGAVAALAMPILSSFSTTMPAGTQAALWVGALAQLATSFKSAFGPTVSVVAKVAAICLFVTASLFAATACAQEVTPSDVAPPLSFCIGASTTCVVPDMGLQTVNYDLTAKAWSGGITSVAVGYAILFASDKTYASGAAIHASFNFDQKTSSYFAPTFSGVAFHWFEAGYTPVFLDGKIEHKLTLGVNVNAESVVSLVTGKNLTARVAARKLELAAENTKVVGQ